MGLIILTVKISKEFELEVRIGTLTFAKVTYLKLKYDDMLIPASSLGDNSQS